MTKPKRPATAEEEFSTIWDEIAEKPEHFRWLWLLTMDHAVPDRLVRAALAIWLHRNSKTGQAFPSQGRLARMLHTTPRTFRRYSDCLVQLGLIASEEGGRGKQTKRYELRDRVKDPTELFDLQYDLETILRAKGQTIRSREVGGPTGRTAYRPGRGDGLPSSNIRREQERPQDHISVDTGTTAREASFEVWVGTLLDDGQLPVEFAFAPQPGILSGMLHRHGEEPMRRAAKLAFDQNPALVDWRDLEPYLMKDESERRPRNGTYQST